MRRFFLGVLLITVGALCAVPVWEQELPLRLGVNLQCLSPASLNSSYEWIFPARNGDNFLLWTTTTTGERQLNITRLNSSGERMWDEPVKVLATGLPTLAPRLVIPWGKNHYAVFWCNCEQFNSDYEYFLQRINENGEPCWQEPVSLREEGYSFSWLYHAWELENEDIAVLTLQIVNEEKEYYVEYITPEGDRSSESLQLPQRDAITFVGAANIENTLYFHYKLGSAGQLQCFLPGQGIIWPQAVSLPVSVLQQGDDTGFYAVTGNDFTVVRRVNAEGNIAWADTIAYERQKPQNLFMPDTGLNILWIDNAHLHVRRYSPDGSITWQNNEMARMTNPWRLQSTQLISDGANGAFLLVRYNSTDDEYELLYQLHHITADGSLEYGPDGLMLFDDFAYRTANVFPNSNAAAVYFTQWEQRNHELYMQCWSAGQQMVPQAQQHIDGGVYGTSGLQYAGKLQQNSDVFCALWLEEYPVPDRNTHLLMQTFDAEGNPLLQENGVVCDVTHNNSYYIDNPIIPDGQGNLYLLRLAHHYGNSSILLNRLGPEGMANMTEQELVFSTENIHAISASLNNGILYLAWADMLPSDGSIILHAQAFDEGTPVWPQPWSLDISQELPLWTYYPVENLSFQPPYLTWCTTIHTKQREHLFAIRVEDGQTAAGWPESGVNVCRGEENALLQTKLAVIDDEMYCYVRELRVSSYIYDARIYKLSATGQPLFGTDGLFLNESSGSFITDILADSDLYAFYTNSNGLWVIKVTAEGTRPWGADGMLIANQLGGENARYFTTHSLADGVYACAWSKFNSQPYRNLDLYFACFDRYGNLYTAGEGEALVEAHHTQSNPFLMGCNGNIIGVWEDQRTCDVSDGLNFSEVYAQRFDIGLVAVDPDPIPASALSLSNWPNPFNPVTTLAYSLPQAGATELAVYNGRGQLVKTLVNEPQTAGDHTALWSGKDDAGRAVASGVYFARLRCGDGVQTRKMLLLK